MSFFVTSEHLIVPAKESKLILREGGEGVALGSVLSVALNHHPVIVCDEVLK
ncbi:MAG: hypothetical protein AB1552_11670 [Nitrospirota bacterium]